MNSPTRPAPAPVDRDEEETGTDPDPSTLHLEARPGREVSVQTAGLEGFFAALSQLENGERTRVRVLHYGDSHTAADFFTTAVRRRLQTRFGDGGRGFISIGAPWPAYNPKDIEVHASGEWTPERILVAADPATQDGYYGLAGVTVSTRDPLARSTVRTVQDTGFGRRTSMFDVFYMVQPGGGVFDVFVDGARKGTVDTNGDRKRTGFFKVTVQEGVHEFEVRNAGTAPLRFFGAAVENDGPGVVYDALGVNGGFFYTPHRWNEEELHVQMKRREPDLLVTMYGTNEIGSKVLKREDYREKVTLTMRRFLDGTNQSACLMIGPPDRVVTPDKEEQFAWIIEVQEEVAAQQGCAFIDLRALMGGPGGHANWQAMSPPLAQTDGIHLTVPGYMALGEQVAAQILEGYEQYRR